MTKGTSGLLLGDRNYWLPTLKTDLRGVGTVLLTPFRTTKHAPPHSWIPVLRGCGIGLRPCLDNWLNAVMPNGEWARDVWHQRNRLIRMILMHTISVFLNIQAETPPLQLEQLVVS